jgi:hypothetical protein
LAQHSVDELHFRCNKLNISNRLDWKVEPPVCTLRNQERYWLSGSSRLLPTADCRNHFYFGLKKTEGNQCVGVAENN